ncbi:DUF3891 family protein [Hymenobacter sp. B81]|uniref:DUF3891 family protein n=1 Tax=Hymenobacter sp. B81 TaxID=3344878 RepID=UPI0037DD4D3A
MIVRATPSSFVYLTQTDHARASGRLAEHWPRAHFPAPARRADVLLAIHEHDRGWQPLDAAPFWNSETQAPYSFLDFPTSPKLVHYRAGLDEVEALAPYAGLLCSRHYADFFNPAEPGAAAEFLAHEQRRQQRLKTWLDLTPGPAEDALEYHLQLLKFCDRLSLYLCLNEPGASKAAEHPWYRAGIPGSDFFAHTGHQLLQAAWLAPDRVQLAPFPFAQEFEVTLPYRELPRVQVRQLGLARSLAAAPEQQLRVRISSPDAA